MSTAETRITLRIAEEIGCKKEQVMAAVALLDEGATVPFIARYRKEVTGGLDDTQLRTLDERLVYLRELEDRRAAILASIDEQGKLTPELAAEIAAAETKQGLEDLYLPYKPKRRTKAQIAREAGIAPLAEALLADPTLSPEAEAEKYLNAEAGFAEVKAVLDGARQILMEKFSEDATLLGSLREAMNTPDKGLKVIVADGECQLARQRRIRPQIAAQLKRGERVVRTRYGVDDEVCTGDHSCIRLSGCPSLVVKPSPDPLRTDPVAHVNNGCVGCGLCGEVADAAVLCPSFYKADIVQNPTWWDRLKWRLRSTIIGALAHA